MAMDEEMRFLGHREVAGKGEEQLDVPALGCDPAGLRFDHVVKAQPRRRLMPNPLKDSGSGQPGSRIERTCVTPPAQWHSELVDPANRHLEWHQAL